MGAVPVAHEMTECAILLCHSERYASPARTEESLTLKLLVIRDVSTALDMTRSRFASTPFTSQRARCPLASRGPSRTGVRSLCYSYKTRQRGWPVLRSVSHRRRPPRKALRLSPLVTPRGSRFIFFTLPPPRMTVSATNESLSCVTQ